MFSNSQCIICESFEKTQDGAFLVLSPHFSRPIRRPGRGCVRFDLRRASAASDAVAGRAGGGAARAVGHTEAMRAHRALALIKASMVGAFLKKNRGKPRKTISPSPKFP